MACETCTCHVHENLCSRYARHTLFSDKSFCSKIFSLLFHWLVAIIKTQDPIASSYKTEKVKRKLLRCDFILTCI